MKRHDEIIASNKLYGLELNSEYTLPDVIVNWCRTVYLENEIFNFNPHRHSFYEIHICLNGSMEYLIDGEKFFLTEDTILLIPPLTEHKLEKLTSEVARFSCGFQLDGETELNKKLSESKIKLHPSDSFIKSQIEYILLKASRDNIYDTAKIKSQIICMLTDVFEMIVPMSKKDKSDYSESVAKCVYEECVKFINDNIFNYITSDDVAFNSGYSLRHLNRILKSNNNISVSELITSLKMIKAKKNVKNFGLLRF